jgi:AraC-like DNA-binding protein
MASASGLLFTFRLIPVIGGVLARAGIDPAALVAQAGLPAEALRGEITAPLARIQAFVDAAARRLGDEVFGLGLAELVSAGVYGVAEFLVRSAPTVEAGLQVLGDYGPLINPIGQFRFVTSPTEGRLHYAVSSQRAALGMHLNEYSIAYILRQVAAVLGGPLPLTEVWFAHGRKLGADAVARRLGCAVRFGAADCGFAVSREVLARVPRTADPTLFTFLDGQARAQLARIGPIDIVTQVVRVIEARMPHGELSAEAIAGVMATTVRSLQRHLALAGTSYRDVLAHVRNRRRGELARGGLPEAEIAHQLGFADARSMRRSLGA